MNAALAIGQLIRARKLDVAVGFTYYAGCEPKNKACALPMAQKGVYRGLIFGNNAFCSSACPLILASGLRRIHSAGASVGVIARRGRAFTIVVDGVSASEEYQAVLPNSTLVSDGPHSFHAWVVKQPELLHVRVAPAPSTSPR